MKTKLRRIAKFGLVGLSGVFVNQGILMLLRFTPLALELRSLIAIEIAILSNFLFNYHWTWRDRQESNHEGISKRLFLFNTSSGTTAILCNYLPLLAMVHFLNWNETIANLIGIGCAAGVNFIVSHLVTFRKKAPAVPV